MLSLFPSAYILSVFVPTFLRLVVATFLLFQTYCLFSSSAPSATRSVISGLFGADMSIAMKILIGFLRVIAAIFLLLGALTQTGSLIALILFMLRIVTHTYRSDLVTTDLLLIILSLCIFILGPGAFAFDYPF